MPAWLYFSLLLGLIAISWIVQVRRRRNQTPNTQADLSGFTGKSAQEGGDDDPAV